MKSILVRGREEALKSIENIRIGRRRGRRRSITESEKGRSERWNKSGRKREIYKGSDSQSEKEKVREKEAEIRKREARKEKENE